MDVDVLIGEVAEILRPGVIEDLRERRELVGSLGELPVAVVDRDLVPVANARLIRVGQIDGAVVLQLLEGMRIVHHRDPSLLAVVVVVSESERVADLVRGELANARQRRLVEHGRLLGARGIRREQSFEDQIVLTVAQRPKRDGGFDDLAGARVGNRAA